jgi:hypothetical protein
MFENVTYAISLITADLQPAKSPGKMNPGLRNGGRIKESQEVSLRYTQLAFIPDIDVIP